MRNVRYWGRYLAEVLEVAVFVAAMLYILVILNMTGDGAGLALLRALPAVLLLGVGAAVMMSNMSAHILYIPLQQSMGCARRECFWGYAGYRAAAVAVFAVVAGAALALVGEDGFGIGTLPQMLLALITVSAVGSLLGLLWSWLKWLAVGVIVLVCGGIGGVVGYFGSEADGFSRLLTLVTGLRSTAGLALIAAVAAALDLGLHWLSLRRQAVKL